MNLTQKVSNTLSDNNTDNTNTQRYVSHCKSSPSPYDEQCQATVKPQTKPTNMGCESAL